MDHNNLIFLLGLKLAKFKWCDKCLAISSTAEWRGALNFREMKAKTIFKLKRSTKQIWTNDSHQM